MAKSAKAARRPRRARDTTSAGGNARQRPDSGTRREDSVDFLQNAAIRRIVVRRALDRDRRTTS